MNNNISEGEIYILNKYLTSELVGGLILGHFARKVDNIELKSQLIWHCEEEIKHSAQWSDLFKKIGLPLVPITSSNKKEFFSYAKEITDPIELLAALHVFEIRVPFHYKMHSLWTKNNDLKEFLDVIVKDEEKHIGWVQDFLLFQRSRNPELVDSAMKKYLDLEEELYQLDLKEWEENEDTKSFVEEIRKNYDNFFKDRNKFALIKNII